MLPEGNQGKYASLSQYGKMLQTHSCMVDNNFMLYCMRMEDIGKSRVGCLIKKKVKAFSKSLIKEIEVPWTIGFGGF